MFTLLLSPWSLISLEKTYPYGTTWRSHTTQFLYLQFSKFPLNYTVWELVIFYPPQKSPTCSLTLHFLNLALNCFGAESSYFMLLIYIESDNEVFICSYCPTSLCVKIFWESDIGIKIQLLKTFVFNRFSNLLRFLEFNLKLIDSLFHLNFTRYIKLYLDKISSYIKI